MKLKTQLFGKTYQFKDVKQVLAMANELRSGDILAGVAAESSQQRVAAKHVLSEMTIADIRMNPVIPYEEDCVTRIIQDDINEIAYTRIKNWRIGELREYILSDDTSVDDIAFLRKGISSEVVAAVAKISSNADLIYGAEKNAGNQKSQYHHRHAGNVQRSPSTQRYPRRSAKHSGPDLRRISVWCW